MWFLFLKVKESLCGRCRGNFLCGKRKQQQAEQIKRLPAEKKSLGSQRSFSAVVRCGI